MKIASKIILAVAAVITVACLHLPAAEPAASTGQDLRVGVAPVTPPMIYKQEKNLVGLEVDLAQSLGRELGRPIRFVELEWEALIDALMNNEIDIIMSSMSITKARQFRINFSAPYLRIGQMALVHGDQKYKYVMIVNSLADRKIGVRKGTTGDLLIQQEFPRAKRKYFKSSDEAAKALLDKKIDLYIDDSTMVWHQAGAHEAKGLAVAPMILSEEYLGWGMRRSDAALQEAVNTFLKKAAASGELDKILRRWIPNFQ